MMTLASTNSGHVCALQELKPLPLPQRSGGNLQQLKAAAAAAATAGLQRLQVFQGFRTGKGGPEGGSSGRDGHSISPRVLSYQSLAQASAPNFGSHITPAAAGYGAWPGDAAYAAAAAAAGGGAGGGVLGGSPPLGMVQRSAASVTMGGKVYNRCAGLLVGRSGCCSSDSDSIDGTVQAWKSVRRCKCMHATKRFVGMCLTLRAGLSGACQVRA
jgi:hypothetical protein